MQIRNSDHHMQHGGDMTEADVRRDYSGWLKCAEQIEAQLFAGGSQQQRRALLGDPELGAGRNVTGGGGISRKDVRW